ncbi:MAG: hypothetical protein HRU69_03870 [Flammeovirgaceae bacterium]|nr:MAG: hypothetical protein HRU69_03870 [Flammeovirgaceae bacterium]
MKDKIRAIVMFLIAGLCIYYGYSQRHEAEVQRAKVEDLYRQIKTLQQEAEAARMEAAKLRAALEKEKATAQQAIEEVQKKSTKK